MNGVNTVFQLIESSLNQIDLKKEGKEKIVKSGLVVFSKINKTLSLPFKLMSSVFSFLKFKDHLNCLYVCKNWNSHSEPYWELLYSVHFPNYQPLSTTFRESHRYLLTWQTMKLATISLKTRPKNGDDFNLCYSLTEDYKLIEVSNCKNSNTIKARYLQTDEEIYSYNMPAPIKIMQLEKARLFFQDEGGKCIFVDLQRLEKRLRLKKIQVLNHKFEKRLHYALTEEAILVIIKNQTMVRINNKNSKIVKIETTANHIICQKTSSTNQWVTAISKKTHKKQPLTVDGHLFYSYISCVHAPYVIVSNKAHQIFIWRENKDHFVLVPQPQILSYKVKHPIAKGWANTFCVEFSPQPLIKCFKDIAMFCADGEIIMWNIHNGTLLSRIKHQISDVVDFCTNGVQLFVYGKNGEYVFYDVR